MSSYEWAQIITLGLAIAVLVILIVVLTRNNLTPSNNELKTLGADAAATGAAVADAAYVSIVKEDNKVNWLYALAIAEAGIVVVFGVLTLLAMMRWTRMTKA